MREVCIDVMVYDCTECTKRYLPVGTIYQCIHDGVDDDEDEELSSIQDWR